MLDQDIDDDGCPFLIMPLLQGETFRARWERAHKRLPVAEVAVLMSDVLDVLTSAHAKGIVHRDVKPENLFVTAEGNVRVLDFGIARRAEIDANPASVTMTGRLIGSPAFMPPEQAIGSRHTIGPPSDCWAAGATIFTLLSGEFVHPEHGAAAQLVAAATKRARSLAAVAPNLPPVIVRFVDKALAFEPDARWPSALEMRGALLEAFAGALGESVANLASRIRPALVTELSCQLEATVVKDAVSRERAARGGGVLDVERRSLPAVSEEVEDSFEPAVREYLVRFRAYQGIEFQVPQGGILFTFQSMPPVTLRLMARYGLGQFNEEGWYIPKMGWWPMDGRLAFYHHWTALMRRPRLIEIATLFAKNQELLVPTEDIHEFFSSFDERYHLRHRKDGVLMYDAASGRMLEGIGHIRYYGEPDGNVIVLEYETPETCPINWGNLIGYARRYRENALVEHAPGPCRDKGDASCIYQITWT